MKSLMMALGTMAMMFAACAPPVVDGGGDGKDAQSNLNGGSVDSAPSALVMRFADAPANVLDVANIADAASVDPDTLVVIFTSTSASCAAPLVDVFLPDNACNLQMPWWQLALFIPPSHQVSNTPIDLSDTQIYFHAGEMFGASPDQCGGGAGEGDGKKGTLVIDDSDPNALALTLSGGTEAMGVLIDGDYTAAGCR